MPQESAARAKTTGPDASGPARSWTEGALQNLPGFHILQSKLAFIEAAGRVMILPTPGPRFRQALARKCSQELSKNKPLGRISPARITLIAGGYQNFPRCSRPLGNHHREWIFCELNILPSVLAARRQQLPRELCCSIGQMPNCLTIANRPP